jgi:hypothetical protein
MVELVFGARLWFEVAVADSPVRRRVGRRNQANGDNTPGVLLNT